MINIAVCDDEEVIANQIENTVWNICEKENIRVDIDIFCSGQDLEREIVNGQRYDLIYLDIQMPGGDGITTAGKIRNMDENVLLIYVSGYDEYMMELFQFDVFAFIKKPIDNKRFEKIFLDAHRKICSKKFYFVFSYKSEEYKIPYMDILYFESCGRSINVHIKDGRTEKFNGKLSDVEVKTAEGKVPFLRIHQSYLVNYHYIKSRSKAKVTLTNGIQLPISEDRQKEFGKRYGRLLGGEIDV